MARLASERDGIEVTGRVPETPPYFDATSVAVAPLRLARGVQNKVLEAMSMGLPVVGTGQAAQGLGEIPDGVFVQAEGVSATTEAVSLTTSPGSFAPRRANTVVMARE